MKTWLPAFVAVSCIGRIGGQDLPSTVSLNFFAGVDWHGALNSNGRDISGIIWTNHPSYCGGGPCIPYNYERNFQGLGLSIGAGLRLVRWEIQFSPELRYDEVHFSFDGGQWQRYKEFIVNPRLGVQRWFRLPRAPQYLGLSYKIVNTRKEFHFFDAIEQVEKKFYLQTPSAVASYGRSIRKSRFFGELQVYYFFKGLPHNPQGPYFMSGLALYSRFAL